MYNFCFRISVYQNWFHIFSYVVCRAIIIIMYCTTTHSLLPGKQTNRENASRSLSTTSITILSHPRRVRFRVILNGRVAVDDISYVLFSVGLVDGNSFFFQPRAHSNSVTGQVEWHLLFSRVSLGSENSNIILGLGKFVNGCIDNV